MLQTPISDKYDDLVGLAYLGINETKPWQGFVECLTEAAAVRDASVTVSTTGAPDNAIIITSDHAPHLTREYVNQVLSTDGMRYVSELEIPRASTCSDLLPSRRWLSSDLYRDYLQPFNIHRMLLIDVWRDPVLMVRLVMERTGDQDDFNDDDRRLLERLAKHLANSMDLRATLQRVRASSEFYQEAMDQLGVGALFLNAAGHVVQSNNTGAELLAQRNGLYLRDGKLAVNKGRTGEHFRAMLRALLSADASTPRGMRLLDDHGNMLLEIVGRRLPSNGAFEAKTPVVVLLVTACREERKEPSAHLLHDLYGFTACEARLAKLLVQGYSAQEAADVLSVSINTVKTHLKGIFEKMGYNKQSQVVAALNNSALRLM